MGNGNHSLRVTILLTLLSSTTAAAEPETATDGSAAEQRIMAAMEQPATFAFHKSTLQTIAKHIETTYQIPVEIDLEGIAKIHTADGHLTFTLSINGVTLRTALHFLLSPIVTWVIRNDSLILTVDAFHAEADVSVEVYNIQDLVPDATNDAHEREKEYDRVGRLISNILHPGLWEKQGGRGKVRCLPSGMIAISQMPAIQAEVRSLLTAIRRAIQQQQLADPIRRYAPVHHGDAAISAAWRKHLTAARDFTFYDTPLDVVAAYLSDVFELTVVVDYRALNNLPKGQVASISYSRIGMRTAAALSQMLGPNRSWYVKDEVLVITSKDMVERVGEVRIYPVSDIVTAEDGRMDHEPLTELIETMIPGDSWRYRDGPGTTEFLPSGNLLVISQTFQNHERIEKILNDLRSEVTQAMEVAPAEPPMHR